MVKSTFNPVAVRADELYVNLMMKGGPAHLSMQVQQGDLLRTVNGHLAESIDPLQVRIQLTPTSKSLTELQWLS